MVNEIYYILIIVAMFVMIILAFISGKSIGKRVMYEIMNNVIGEERKDAIKRSRAVIGGQVNEQISPYLPNFPAEPSECSFLGKPVDFIAFRGLDEKYVSEIVFIEVKTGKSQLNKTEKSIKDAIKNKRVRFEEYRID